MPHGPVVTNYAELWVPPQSGDGLWARPAQRSERATTLAALHRFDPGNTCSLPGSSAVVTMLIAG